MGVVGRREGLFCSQALAMAPSPSNPPAAARAGRGDGRTETLCGARQKAQRVRASPGQRLRALLARWPAVPQGPGVCP